jgi:hypothetical protein
MSNPNRNDWWQVTLFFLSPYIVIGFFIMLNIIFGGP